jgi:hypothetical protein
MTNPRDHYLADLMESVDVDLTKALDDEIVRVDPIESQPGEDVPIESGPIIYDGGWDQHPHHEPPHESGPIFWEPGPGVPAPGPASDPGPIDWEDPNYPGDDPNDGPNYPQDHDPNQGPNPDEGWDPDAPAPDEPQPGEYPEDKNCWEVPDVEDSPPSEPMPDEIDCGTTGGPMEEPVHADVPIV